MWRAATASTFVRAPRSLVYGVLKGYELYRAWAPDILSSRLFAREGEIAVAELVCPRYTGEKFLLELVESPETAISFHRIDHDRLELRGGWRLEEAEGGEGVLVHGELELDTGWYRIFARRILQELLTRTLEALKERSLRIAAARRRGAPAEGELILDLRRGPDGMEVRMGGRTFQLDPGEEPG